MVLKKMTRIKHKSTKDNSITHLILTGENQIDMQIWQLSFVLADIASQNNQPVTEKEAKVTLNRK
jgi:hypothetical protein